MKRIFKFGYIMATMLLLVGVFNACKEDEKLEPAPRLFRPITEGESGGQWIQLTWDVLKDAESYTIELSVDSFATIDTTIYALESPLLIEKGIEWDTQYQIRIKTVGSGLESEFYVCEDVKVPDYPTLLKDIPSKDIIDNAVIVRWDSDDVPFTSLEFSMGDVIIQVPLTTDDLTKGYKEVSGLSADTNYVVKIFSETVYRGKKKFATLAAQDFLNPVDLRELSSEEAIDTLNTSFLNAIIENSTVVLKGGQEYKINATLPIVKNVKFVTGYSFSGNAQITLVSNFTIAANTTIQKVEFENINFVTGGDKMTANYGGKYIFNISNSGAVISEVLSIENCSIKYLRGVVRTQAGPTIQHVKINNCILDSIGGYGVINCDNAAGPIHNMTLTNSTVSHADKILVNSKCAMTGNVLVDNVTFCWSPTGPTGYYLDFGAITIAGNVTISDCILSCVNVTSTAQTANGYRSGSNSIVASGNYMTSDFTWTLKVDGITLNSVPIDATSYAKSYTNLWVNPAKGNFNYLDTKFEGKETAGDPRWR